MPQPRSAVERALFTVLALVLPAALLAATPLVASPSAGAATSGPGTLYNETFEYGTRGWSTSPRARLTTVADGRRSHRAARLQARRPGRTVVRSKSYAHDLRGSRHVVSVWLRSTRGRVPATLVVQEVARDSGKVLSVERDAVRLGKQWKRAQVTVRRSSHTSILTVAVRTRQSRLDRVLLDDVKISRKPRRAPVPTRSPSPTPSQTPSQTPGQAPATAPTVAAGTDVAGTLSNGCTYSRRGIPSCGAYLGSAYGSNTEPAPFESTTGQRLGVRRTYFQGNQVDKAVATARDDLAAGRLPWISFKLPLSWEDMAAGRGDAWARDIATRLKALDGPVWIAFHHEPEKDGNILAWRGMQERLAPLVRSTAPNVAFTVITTGWNQLYGPTEYRLENLWPRNVKIDVAGFDVYNFHLFTHADGRRLTKPDDIRADYFEKFSTWAKANDTTWALAETGQTDESFAVDPGWIPRTHRAMVETGGVAMSYFNTTLNSFGNTFPIVSDAKVEAFRAAQKGSPLLPRR